MMLDNGWVAYLNKRKSTAWAGTIQSTASQQRPSNGSASPADHGLISAISDYSVDDNNIPVKAEKDLAEFKKANAGKYALEDEADVTTFTDEELTNQVLTAYPTAQNVEATGNGVTFILPNGMRITHNYEDHILVAEEETGEASKAYGRNVKAGEGAFGKTTIVNEGAVVSLTRDNKSGTVDHEAFHVAYHTVLSSRERAKLEGYARRHMTDGKDATPQQAEEFLAEDYRKTVAKWRDKEQHGSMLGKAWLRLEHWAYQV